MRQLLDRCIFILTMKTKICILLGTMLSVLSVNGEELAGLVKPIDWSRFEQKVEPSPEFVMSSKIVANAARYSLHWADTFYKANESGDRYVIENQNEEWYIRPPASAALGIAMALKTGIDPKEMGAPEEVIITRTRMLIKGVASLHKVNGGAWGDHWQSSMWAAQAGRAAWMLWDALDAETREWTARMVVHEADRFIRPGYKIKYWNGEGGDSKAEELSWDAMSLQLAVAMMPDHPHVPQWKAICCRMLVSAYCRPSDMERTQPLVDGKPPKDWLDGYNIREDGVVINHDLIHNDYICSIAHLQMQGFIVFPLAGQVIPESTDFGFEVVYRTLVTKSFDSPPYKAPGGTMYIPGSPEQYYPQGTDWSQYRYASFFGMDSLADVLGYDKDLPRKAADWRKLRAERIYELQSRHEDGRMYAKGEYDTYWCAEQMVFWMMTDGHFLQWLVDRGVRFERGDWLAE